MQTKVKPLSVVLFYAIAFTFAQPAIAEETESNSTTTTTTTTNQSVTTTTEVNNLSTGSVDQEALPSGANSLGFDQNPVNSNANLPTVSTSSDDGNCTDP
ncbi:MAG: hypothetical protein KIT34_15005 [Cyanobacteria bacterium TGS_CYA1]|nr:hypothetical protein [Cyanobacteria bacterium TGS_CYA1]